MIAWTIRPAVIPRSDPSPVAKSLQQRDRRNQLVGLKAAFAGLLPEPMPYMLRETIRRAGREVDEMLVANGTPPLLTFDELAEAVKAAG